VGNFREFFRHYIEIPGKDIYAVSKSSSRCQDKKTLVAAARMFIKRRKPYDE